MAKDRVPEQLQTILIYKGGGDFDLALRHVALLNEVIGRWLVPIFWGDWEVIGGDSKWLAWILMRKNVATMVLWAVIEGKKFREQGAFIILKPREWRKEEVYTKQCCDLSEANVS